MTERAKRGARQERMLMAAGATAAACGIVLSTGESVTLGGMVTLAGVALAVFGLHRFGRLGPDGGTQRGPRKPKRRKRPPASRERS